jgi:hypothetical protein
MYAIGQVVIPFLQKQDKRFGVSRINRIERALFNNRKLAIEVVRQRITLPYSCAAKRERRERLILIKMYGLFFVLITVYSWVNCYFTEYNKQTVIILP